MLQSNSLSHLEILRDRSKQLRSVRAFFEERHVCEVDTPLLCRGAALDAHIDLFATDVGNGQMRYLHSSPEFGMKRLLAEGMGDIYQLSHVYRLGELSPKHQPEFTMIEWYRVAMSFSSFMDETIDLLRLLLGPLPKQHLTYRQAFLRYTQMDPFEATVKSLKDFLNSQGVRSYEAAYLNEAHHRDDLLNQILGLYIEPHLGWNDVSDCLTILSHYPATQAALARTTTQEGNIVAERFEVYCKGIELANGYHELADVQEQLIRFTETNQLRVALGKQPLPIDSLFLQALEAGLPECCGVAVGFDRLMMLRHQKEEISQVLPLAWGAT